MTVRKAPLWLGRMMEPSKEELEQLELQIRYPTMFGGGTPKPPARSVSDLQEQNEPHGFRNLPGMYPTMFPPARR